jgi:hypothetical protein
MANHRCFFDSFMRGNMKTAVTLLTVPLVLAYGLALGCSSSSKAPADKIDSGGLSDGGNVETVGSFIARLIDSPEPMGTVPPYTYVHGEVYDGPTPNQNIDTQLPPPADATPGCAVYSVGTPDCSGIGGCSIGSSNAACAAAASTSGNTCVCVAKDTCQAFPTKKNVGDVTISGVATTTGATTFQLVNGGNSYNVDVNTTTLAYPGFGEDDTIKVSATGGEYGPFEISASGVAPLTLVQNDIHLVRDPSSDDPTRYQALTIDWNPQASANPASIHVKLDISLHASEIGYLACDAKDTGSLTLSAGLISQLVTLGNVGGYPEIGVTRSATSSTRITPGKVDLIVESYVERFPTIDGFISCGEDNTKCPDGQVCNTGNKLCETP